MHWIFLLAAIIFEVGATSCMKLSEGFTKIVPSIAMFILYGLCFTFLTMALQTLELGIVYSIWSGLGTLLIVSIGIVLFQESTSLIKVASILLIILGVIGLKLSE